MRYISIIAISVILLSFSQTVPWFSFLGKTFEDGDVKTHFNRYGEYTSNEFRNDYETQVNWTEHGIAITMNDFGELQKVYFYNDQYTLKDLTFNRFNGVLPMGLSLDMSPEKIKEKVGKPTKEEGNFYKLINYQTTYEYEFLFKNGVMQYMRIGLLPKEKETESED